MQRSFGSAARAGYDAALIMLGTNDLAHKGVTAEQVVAAIVEMHTVCHSYGLRTVALPIPPSFFSATKRDDLVEYQTMRIRVNAQLKEWAVRWKFTLFCRVRLY